MRTAKTMLGKSVCIFVIFQALFITNTDSVTGNQTESASCDMPAIKNHTVVLECWSHTNSPQADCKFNISTDVNRQFNKTSKEMNYSIHISPVQRTSETLYKLSCVLRIGIANLGRGLHDFQMVVSSNRSDTNRSVVTSNTVSVNVETSPVINLSTQYSSGDDNVNLTCYTELFLEPVQCEYRIKAHGHLINVSALLTLEEYFDVYGFYISECSLRIPTRNLGFGRHLMQVILVSKDANGNVIRFPTLFMEASIYPPTVELGSECVHLMESTYTRPGERKECRCYLKYPGIQRDTFRWEWTAENGSVYYGQLREKLLLVDYDLIATFHTFTCQPLSSIPGNITGVQFTPQIINTTEDIIFTANNETNILEVNVDETVTFLCLSIASNIAIYKLGFPDVTTSSPFTFVKNMSKCRDSADYVCRATSQNGNVYEKNIEVLVKCPLRQTGPVEIFYDVFQAKVKLNITGYPMPNRHALVSKSQPGSWRPVEGYTFRYTQADKTMAEIMMIVTEIYNTMIYKTYKLYVSNDDSRPLDYISSFNLSKDEMNTRTSSYSKASKGIIFIVLVVHISVFLSCIFQS